MQQVDLIGNVEGRDGKAVVGATVSVIGYPDQATTDSMGSFRLGSHAADGQMVTIRIKKGALQGQYTIPAGKASTVNLI
jgi:sugar lactone lactonase YvrE